MSDLEALRRQVRPLLDLDDPADAVAAYYALYHAPGRTQLHIHTAADERADGFAAVCQTGRRLFQPTVALRAADERVATELLRRALIAERPYHILTPPGLRDAVAQAVTIDAEATHHLYQLDLTAFTPVINVLVVEETMPNGLPRFVIRSRGGEIVAESGVNWVSPHVAEVYVQTVAAARGRGLGKSVLAACTTWSVQSGRRSLYVVEAGNEPSRALAESLGYVDSGARELAIEGIFKG